MQSGETTHNLDAKARFALPLRHRRPKGTPEDKDTGEYYMTRGPERCILLIAPADWKALEEASPAAVIPAPDTRRFQRLFFAKAKVCSIDPQGRISVPSDLLEYAGIEKELVLIGAGTRLEIWAPDVWKEYDTQDANEYTRVVDNEFQKRSAVQGADCDREVSET